MNPAEQSPIHSADVVITQNCSLRCSYCFAGEKHCQVMPEDRLKRCLDWLLSADVSWDLKRLKINFWGGEPLLEWPLIERVVPWGYRKARETGKVIEFGMTTNGMHLTSEVVQGLQRYKLGCLISFDGSRETQDGTRKLPGGGGSYDKIVANLPNIFAVRPMQKVRATVTAGNAHRYDLDMIHLFDLGFKRVIGCPAYEGDWAAERLEAYSAAITILANDRNGLLVDITNAFVELKIPIRTINARTTKEKIAIISMSIEILNTDQLDKTIKKMRRIESVFEVKRSSV